MTDATGLEALFDPIRKAMADMEAERLRYGYIADTIRANARYRSATEKEVEDFVHGRADFIAWLADKVERPAPTLAEALALPQIAAVQEAARALEAGLGRKGVDVGSLRVKLWQALNACDAALAAVKGGE